MIIGLFLHCHSAETFFVSHNSVKKLRELIIPLAEAQSSQRTPRGKKYHFYIFSLGKMCSNAPFWNQKKGSILEGSLNPAHELLSQELH